MKPRTIVNFVSLTIVIITFALAWREIHRVVLTRSPRPRQRTAPQNHTRSDSESSEDSGGCQALGFTCATQYFAAWAWPKDGSCRVRVRRGYPIPDARCTPGGVVPNVTVETLRDPSWRTRCIRNCQSSESQKHVAYAWYGLLRPADNSGQNQICELDHLVPLELGGADGLGNIWPQCGPDETVLRERYFKRKDRVERYLAGRVRGGSMSLGEAQEGIATDWTQYLEASRAIRK